jgi:hypothetical protein
MSGVGYDSSAARLHTSAARLSARGPSTKCRSSAMNWAWTMVTGLRLAVVRTASAAKLRLDVTATAPLCANATRLGASRPRRESSYIAINRAEVHVTAARFVKMRACLAAKRGEYNCALARLHTISATRTATSSPGVPAMINAVFGAHGAVALTCFRRMGACLATVSGLDSNADSFL